MEITTIEKYFLALLMNGHLLQTIIFFIVNEQVSCFFIFQDSSAQGSYLSIYLKTITNFSASFLLPGVRILFLIVVQPYAMQFGFFVSSKGGRSAKFSILYKVKKKNASWRKVMLPFGLTKSSTNTGAIEYRTVDALIECQDKGFNIEPEQSLII